MLPNASLKWKVVKGRQFPSLSVLCLKAPPTLGGYARRCTLQTAQAHAGRLPFPTLHHEASDRRPVICHPGFRVVSARRDIPAVLQTAHLGHVVCPETENRGECRVLHAMAGW
jgi:hypothetical protein